ncbi:MAG TPA: RagB/SusD family nutrient uptake outer membrane protein [Gemmatimonadaceae bacterium]|nr:RagB/SusD family nutrient uptake outer membrane protein [Gemmatimonadaceae bacterium]
MTSATCSTWGRAISLACLVVAVACEPVDAPDQNAQALSDLTGSPSVSAVATATQGLIRGLRGTLTTQLYSRLGREGYNLDPGNPQNFPAYYTTLADLAPWAGPYATIKLANLVVTPLDRVTGLTAPQRESIRGFAKTIKAIELLIVIRGTDVGGALLDAAANATDPPAPIASKAEVYAEILKLLDEAQTHLKAGGSSFPFLLGSGFAGFDTPTTFLTVNRAIRARANIDLKNWSAALVDLGGSFLNTTAPLSRGVYHTYSLVSGDVTNNLYEGVPRLYFVHPRIQANAQKKADGTPDSRVAGKVRSIPPFARFGLTNVSATWTNYPSQTASIPFLRNEELILLRAEANLGNGNAAAALVDINFIRVNSGGLPPLTLPYTPAAGAPPTLLDELLYNKTYSLMWEEGSSSWLDARRYGKLAQLPHDLPGHVVFPYLRIADLECDARNPKPPGCTSPAGL